MQRFHKLWRFHLAICALFVAGWLLFPDAKVFWRVLGSTVTDNEQSIAVALYRRDNENFLFGSALSPFFVYRFDTARQVATRPYLWNVVVLPFALIELRNDQQGLVLGSGKSEIKPNLQSDSDWFAFNYNKQHRLRVQW